MAWGRSKASVVRLPGSIGHAGGMGSGGKIQSEVVAVFTKINVSEAFRNIPKDLLNLGIILLSLLFYIEFENINTTLRTKICLK